MINITKYNNDYTYIYKFIHIIFGGILALKHIPDVYKKRLFYSIIIYQFGQLILNIRYFLIKNKIYKGNSINHTLNKLLDHLYGYILVLFIYKIYN